MDFATKLLQGLSFLPAVVSGVADLPGNKSGQEKKAAALSFLDATLPSEKRWAHATSPMKPSFEKA